MFSFTKRRLLCDRAALAKWGEMRARRFLEKKGCATLAQNYLCKTGELDLVMADPDGTIVFVEVKARTADDFAQPEDSITASKKQITLDQKSRETVRHYKSAFTF
jgi:putative endonuclease